MNLTDITEFSKLYEAHLLSRRSKRDRNDVVSFEMNLGTELIKLQQELRDGYYRPRPYSTFVIHDPKERTIHALQYRDRIVQHTLCDNVIALYMERHLIYDNAASRKGKGTHFAIDRLSGFMRKYYKEHGTEGYILKYDIRKFYDNMDHEILKKLFDHAFPDKEIQWLLHLFIDSYETFPGKGLPLGNQTSQWFALYYLDGLDRLIKEKFRIKYYSRYMDDGILIHHDKEYLRQCLTEMNEYIKNERKLEFNRKTQIVPISQGIDYLGFHFYLTESGKVVKKLRNSNKKRIKKKLKRYRHAYRTGKMTEEEVHRSIVSYMGHLSHGDTWHLRENLLSHLVLSNATEKERREHEEEIKACIDQMSGIKGMENDRASAVGNVGSHHDSNPDSAESAGDLWRENKSRGSRNFK